MAELKLRFQRFAFRFFFFSSDIFDNVLPVSQKNCDEKSCAKPLNTQQKLRSEKIRFFISVSITLNRSVISEIRVKKHYGRQIALEWIQLKSQAYIFSMLRKYTCFVTITTSCEMKTLLILIMAPLSTNRL